jgi:MYXO-CTERM domain-containing protein
MTRNSTWVVLLAMGLSPGLLPGTAAGSLITLQDNNSTVTFDPASSAGVESWTVDGVNQLYQQWFWYRMGGSGQAASIDTLGTATKTQYSANYATVSYTGTNGLAISVGYTLSGGAPGSGASDLGENISIQNTSQSSQTIDFFQYSNFVLLGSDNPTGDDVQFQNSNAVDQWKNGSSESLSETVITPKPNDREAGQTASQMASHDLGLPVTLNEFANPSFTHLSDPNTNTTSPVLGPGDMTWAYEWDKTLAPGGTLLISKDKQLSGVTPATPTPEPSSMALAMAGLLACFFWRRRRKASS